MSNSPRGVDGREAKPKQAHKRQGRPSLSPFWVPISYPFRFVYQNQGPSTDHDPYLPLLLIRWRSDGSNEPSPPRHQVLSVEGSLAHRIGIPSTEYVEPTAARIFHQLITDTACRKITPPYSPHVAAESPLRARHPVGWRSDGSNQPFAPMATPWSDGPHNSWRRSDAAGPAEAGPSGCFSFGLATRGPIIRWTREPSAVPSPSSGTYSTFELFPPLFRCRTITSRVVLNVTGEWRNQDDRDIGDAATVAFVGWRVGCRSSSKSNYFICSRRRLPLPPSNSPFVVVGALGKADLMPSFCGSSIAKRLESHQLV